jgi:hypothetical protein
LIQVNVASRDGHHRRCRYSTASHAKAAIWLHKQVMAKLAANGGKVPADLKH